MSAEFQTAVTDSKKLKSTPSNDELLQLYAYFKQGSGDAKFEDATKPGAFDLRGKAKYNAWKDVHETGISPEAAQKKYVEIVEELKTKYGYDG